ncbi:MAG: hypothetical protein QOE61_5956, partial [Micromonosporaceae bacterium]|nr:hypothetical protein [Micromonosporaceae bacterium]
APGDYTSSSPTITVHAGDTTGHADVPIINDAFDEPDYEPFTVTGSTGNTGSGDDIDSVLSTGGPVTVRIQDNDVAPTVSTSDPGVVTEGAVLTFHVTLSAPSNQTVTVQADTEDGTASSVNSADYDAITAQTVTFSPGSQSEDVVVLTHDDSLNELNPETVKLKLSSPHLATAGTMTAIGGITDDDNPPVVTLSPSPVTEGESGTRSQTFTVHLDAPSGRPVHVGYHVSSGTATAGEDFVAPADGEVVFAPGSQAETFTVGIKGDTKDEPDETVTITLSNSGTATGPALGSNSITITDDDAAPTLDTLHSVTMPEGDATDTVDYHVGLSNPSSQPITLDVTSMDDSAVSSGGNPGQSDYSLPSATVIVPAGASGVDVPVTINGDAVYEGTEHATITVATQADDTTVAVGILNANLYLTNDDSMPTVQLNTSAGDEGGDVPVTATVTGVSQDPITIDVSGAGASDNGSVAATADDFTDVGLTATDIPGGVVSNPLALGSVHLAADQINELTQTVEVSLTGVPHVAPVFIAIIDDSDDMLPTITLGTVTVAEASGTPAIALLPVTLDFGVGDNLATSTEQDISAHYQTADGTAMKPGDYTTTSGTVSFAAGTTTRYIPVTITNDNAYEPSEAFAVNLSLSSPALTPIAATAGAVTITDDDNINKPSLDTLPNITMAEGHTTGTATFHLGLTQPSTVPIILDVTSTPDTAVVTGNNAVGGADFSLPSPTVTVAAGETEVDVPVTINGDAVYEGAEHATITVTPQGADPNVNEGGVSATLTLTNDDAMPTVVLNTSAGNEGDDVAVTATVTGVSQDPITIDVSGAGASDNGSDAADPGDFTDVGLNVTQIPGGVVSNPLALGSVHLAADQINELTQTVEVSLTGVPHVAPVFIAIADDVHDMLPTITPGAVTVAESDGTAHLPVILDFGVGGNDAISTERDISAHYQTADGTAKKPGDYTDTSGTVSFPAGTTSQSIPVDVTPDGIYEATEAFAVNLSLSSPALTPIAATPGAVTITDDDNVNKPSLDTLPDVAMAEGNTTGTATFHISLTHASSLPTTLNVSATDDTAKFDGSGPGSVDFTLPSATVVVAAGDTGVDVPVTINGDTVYEGTEHATITVATQNADPNVNVSSKTATLTLTNDDAMPTVQLNTSAGNEGQSVAVTATVTGVSQDPIPFTLLAQGGSDNRSVAADPADLVSHLTVTQIPGGVVSNPLALGTVDLVSDHINELTQTVQISLTGLQQPVTPVFIAITDDSNDKLPTITPGAVTVAEASGSAVTAQLPVTLDFGVGGNDASSTEQDISAHYQTADGTAKKPGDYTDTSGTVSFPAGTTSQNVPVTITNDNVYEATEAFAVNLSSSSPALTPIAATPGAVTITDDDSGNKPSFTFTAPVGSIREDAGTANFTLHLSAVTEEDVDFTVTTTDNTAKHGYNTPGNDDFVAPATTVRVPAGQDTVLVPVPIKTDFVYEPTENASIEVARANGENDAIGTPQTATLTIFDDDAIPTVTLSSSAAPEGTNLAVYATVTGVAQNDLPVTLTATGAVNAGSIAADGAADFDAVGLAGAVIPGGTHASPIPLGSILFKDDKIDEYDQTIRVSMTGLAVTPIPGWETIIDNTDDMTPEVSIGNASVVEGTTPVHVPVALDFAQQGNDAISTEKTVVVHYATANGSA